MKSLNAKKIAAVAAGAALLGFGLAFASPVNYGSVPIITNTGQPVVQVVVGSGAQPIDAVSAGNIAAAIGNLAFTKTTQVFPANVTQAESVLGVSASASQYTLSNQKVTLNVSSSTVLSGAYSFTGLIGSVLNHGLQTSSFGNTKTPQDVSSYAYLETPVIQSTPSPYTAAGSVPWSSVTATYNGGGTSWSSFTSSSYDNILRVTNSELPSLLSNYGSYGENEYLWVTGFPVYNQNAKALELASAGGAYQVTFNKPIQIATSSNAVNNAAISLLGQNWTIISYNAITNGLSGTSTVSAANTVSGGKISLASSLTPWTTLYVTGNLTAGPYKLVLTGLGNTNQNGVSQAAISIYYQNATTPTNTSVLSTGINYPFNVSGNRIFVKVNQTFNGGSFASQQWAKVQLYTNVYNITSGQQFNKTNDPGWNVNLLWTNSSGSTAGKVDALQSIVLYNATPTTLQQGQSLSFIQDPVAWKLQFVGTTLGSSSFDPLTASLSTSGSEMYQNLEGSALPTNITEPAQLLTVSSSIPNAFSYGGTTSSQIVYDLTPYALAVANTFYANDVLTMTLSGATNTITANNQLTVSVYGAQTSGGSVTQLAAETFDGSSTTATLGVSAFNVTKIVMSKAMPVSVAIQGSNSANVVTLNLQSPEILYQQTGKDYLSAVAGTSAVAYNLQNGQTNSTVQLSFTNVNPVPGTSTKFGSFTVSEYDVPSSTSYSDSLAFGIYNSTLGSTAYPSFMLNESSTGTRNNMTYTSSAATSVQAPVGFVTERGSNVGSISPTSVTINYAENVNQMQFAIGPSSNATLVQKGYAQYTYGLGQAVSLPGYSGNVSVGGITATVTPTGAGGTSVITGINSVVSNPVSVVTPVLLTSLPTTPLVVLDTNVASSQDALILVGSGYVNSLSKNLETALNVTDADLNVTGGKVLVSNNNQILVAGWTGAQTQAAANAFIQQLYANAASTSS